jgi:hypothetical protein
MIYPPPTNLLRRHKVTYYYLHKDRGVGIRLLCWVFWYRWSFLMQDYIPRGPATFGQQGGERIEASTA